MKRLAPHVLVVVLIALVASWIMQGRLEDRRLRALPVLLVELRGDLEDLDVEQYRRAFRQAGVERVALRAGEGVRRPLPPPDSTVVIEPAPLVARVVLEGRRGPNPHVTEESRRLGRLGPGYTVGDTAIVYVDELRQYMRKHNAVWLSAMRQASEASPAPDGDGPLEPLSIWRRLVTNTAVHESWHAVTRSHSHNPVDIDSVMYINARDNVRQMGTRWLDFTRGHRIRLQQMFGHIGPTPAVYP